MPDTTANRLLCSLTAESRDQILSLSDYVALPVGMDLYGSRRQPTRAFFLESGFASQVITSVGSASAEVGLIYRDGMVGHLALLGPALSEDRCFMQAAGAGYSLPFAELEQLFHHSEEIRSRILEFAQEHIAAGSYIGACNKLHQMESRLARWLLMVQDRLETEILPITQEYLAAMLGTRRMTVSVAAGALQKSGFIEYTRGRVRILDRAGLTDVACECYGYLRKLDERLYQSATTT